MFHLKLLINFLFLSIVDQIDWHAQWDPTIIMAVHNHNDILMLHYEDLPDRDKGTISEATEEF